MLLDLSENYEKLATCQYRRREYFHIQRLRTQSSVSSHKKNSRKGWFSLGSKVKVSVRIIIFLINWQKKEMLLIFYYFVQICLIGNGSGRKEDKRFHRDCKRVFNHDDKKQSSQENFGKPGDRVCCSIYKELN